MNKMGDRKKIDNKGRSRPEGCILFRRFWKPSHARFEKAFQNRNGKIIFFCFPFPFLPTIPLFFKFFFFFLFSFFPLPFLFYLFLPFFPPLLISFPICFENISPPHPGIIILLLQTLLVYTSNVIRAWMISLPHRLKTEFLIYALSPPRVEYWTLYNPG